MAQPVDRPFVAALPPTDREVAWEARQFKQIEARLRQLEQRIAELEAKP